MTAFLATALLALTVTVDGRLDEAEWKNAAWKDGVAVLKAADAVYVGMKGEKLEVFFAPTGQKFDYYRFAMGPSAADCTAAFFSEGGNIQPDPFAPFWPHKSAQDGGTWTHEAKIPLAAFYMTRNRDWKEKWLVRRNGGAFEAEDGFPVRAETDDVVIRSVAAKISSFDGKAFAGDLKLEVFAAKGGAFTLKTTAGGAPQEVNLRAGENRVKAACRYAQRGRVLTHFVLTRKEDGSKTGRSYPVLVDYEAIAVKLTTPQYRNNFYPGQDASRVEGTVAVAPDAEATVALEGPGFRRQEAKVRGRGVFAFDTRGFRTGDATLTVTCGTDVKTVRVRNLPPTGHQMVWVENGYLVVNGRPVLRRNIYADGWQCGKAFTERFEREKTSFCKTPEFEKYIHISPDWLIGSEADAKKDVRPSDAYFKKLDEVLAKNREADFGYYYICDEPECRGISQVYLKHIYDYVAEKDPYHPMLTASRGGKTYVDCADWFETHPYLAPRNQPDGTRTYHKHPNEVGAYLDAFECQDRPDKVIGFLPTCFAYRWQSLLEDYPTFDEYVLHTWAAMMRGGKSLWPYAGHDIGDRPSIYEGTRYMFSSFAALEDIVLKGKRTTFAKSPEEEGVLYELGDERMFVVVNFTAKPHKVALPGVTGDFREFRGTRRWKTGLLFGRALEPIELKPFEAVVACTVERDKGLPTFAEVRAKALKDEAERTGRDNQLLGREADIVFSSNLKVRGFYKLVDGTRDMLSAYSDWKTDAFLEMAFTKFVPRFSKVRMWGRGKPVEKMRVSVRQRGEWRTLEPKNVVRGDGFVEFDFGEPVSTVKMRLSFPGEAHQRNDFEIYELEVPQCAAAAGAAARRKSKPAEDRDVKWRYTGKDAAEAVVGWSGSKWMVEKEHPDALKPLPSGGFSASGYFTRYVEFDPDHRWIVLDMTSYRDATAQGYRAWNAHWTDKKDKLHYIAGTITNPQAGIYTYRLPEGLEKGTYRLLTYVYGLTLDFNSIALMAEPANRVELDCTNGVAKIRVFFAEPCEDVAAEFLVAPRSGGLNPYAVNGTNGIELKPLDAEQRVWGADIEIRTCTPTKSSVYVKASALGGGLTRPLFGRFVQALEAKGD